MTKTTTVLLWAALACAPSAHASWECTMPNGRTIQRQFGPCPPDAIDARQTAQDTTAERPFVHIPKPAEADRPKAVEQRPKPAPKEQPKKPPEEDPPSVIDAAHNICAAMRRGGATTCEVDYNMFSASTIDATVNLIPAEAQLICMGLAKKTHQPGTAFSHYRAKGGSWWLKLYHPMGSSNRPTATCEL